MQSKLRIHVATVDHHVERMIEPMIRHRADKAYLLAFGEKDSVSEFLKRAKTILKKEHVTVQVVYVDIWDLMACINAVRKIIQDEKNNQVFLNVSTGTKISAISFMLACMLWNCEPYYAKTEYSDIKIPRKITSEKIKEVIEIPTYKIITPKQELLLLLKTVKDNEGRIKKKYLIEELKKLELIIPIGTETLSKPAEHGQLRTMLEPMIKMGYVEVENVGRNSFVSITKQGKNTLEIFGT